MRRSSKRVFTHLFMLAALAASQGAKAPGTSMSSKRIDALEESQEQRFFSRIVCAAVGGMTGSLKASLAVLQDRFCDMQGYMDEKET